MNRTEPAALVMSSVASEGGSQLLLLGSEEAEVDV